MTSLLFYKKPIPLNSTTHAEVRVNLNPEDYSFAKKTNSVPISCAEFYDAQRDYPIVFANAEGGDVSPVALLGLKASENLFINNSHRWEASYIPVFAKCYPFVLARSDDRDDYLVCLDQDSSAVNKEKGEVLFKSNGKESDFLREKISILSNFQGQIDLTRTFAKKIHQAGLLKEITIQVIQEKEDPLTLQGVQVVDEEKLMAMKDDQILDFFKRGELGWIYAHLSSLRNVQVLSRKINSKHSKNKKTIFNSNSNH